MDFTGLFKSRGYKFKYTYILGDVNDKENIKVIDAWKKEELTTKELEDEKRLMMKEYSLPLITVEIEEI